MSNRKFNYEVKVGLCLFVVIFWGRAIVNGEKLIEKRAFWTQNIWIENDIVADTVSDDSIFGNTPETMHLIKEKQLRMPEYRKGKEAMNQFIRKNLIYPKEALKLKKEGKVYVQFVVEKDGSISNIEVVKSAGYILLDTEAKRVVSKMPKWQPALLHGKPVRAYCTLPVGFKLLTPHSLTPLQEWEIEMQKRNQEWNRQNKQGRF